MLDAVNDYFSSIQLCLAYTSFCIFLHCLFYIIENFFSILNVKKYLAKNIQLSYFNRLVSSFHALIMFSNSLYYWININPTLEITQYNNHYQMKCLIYMIGYLVYDTLFELLFTKQIDTLGHHILGMILCHSF